MKRKEKRRETKAMTPARRATYEVLTALSRKTAQGKTPGATSEHSDLYDDDGLPR